MLQTAVSYILIALLAALVIFGVASSWLKAAQLLVVILLICLLSILTVKFKEASRVGSKLETTEKK